MNSYLDHSSYTKLALINRLLAGPARGTAAFCVVSFVRIISSHFEVHLKSMRLQSSRIDLGAFLSYPSKNVVSTNQSITEY